MSKMGAMEWTALVLIIVGALNWGLVGLFGYNFVDAIFQVGSVISRIIYMVIGLAGVYEIIMLIMPPQRN